jgi:hypothetical protein
MPATSAMPGPASAAGPTAPVAASTTSACQRRTPAIMRVASTAVPARIAQSSARSAVPGDAFDLIAGGDGTEVDVSPVRFGPVRCRRNPFDFAVTSSASERVMDQWPPRPQGPRSIMPFAPAGAPHIHTGGRRRPVWNCRPMHAPASRRSGPARRSPACERLIHLY